MNNSDLARDIAITLASRSMAEAKGWSWSKGVVLFPEARCPFCREVMKSRALWLVRGNYLLGQAVPVAGRELVLDRPSHPHATPSAICMGNAVDPLQALFNGLNPKSSSFNTGDQITGGMCDWLRGPYWEHTCSEMDEAEERVSDDDHEDDFLCAGCEEYFDECREFNYEYYCESCFNERAFICHACGGTFVDERRHTGPDDRSYCGDCYCDRFFCCENCEEDFSSDEANSTNWGTYCDDCWGEKFFRCTECEESCKVEQRIGSSDLCDGCGSICEQCQSSYVDDEGEYCVYCIKTVCDSCFQLHGEQCKGDNA